MSEVPPRKKQRKNGQDSSTPSAAPSPQQPVHVPVQSLLPQASLQAGGQPLTQFHQLSAQMAASLQLPAASLQLPVSSAQVPVQFFGQFTGQGVAPGAPAMAQAMPPGQFIPPGLQPLRVGQPGAAVEAVSPLQSLAQQQLMSQQSFAQRDMPIGAAGLLSHPSAPGSSLLQMVTNASLPVDSRMQGNPLNADLTLPAMTQLGPFSRRERYFDEQEKLGKLRIEYVHNDGNRQSLIWLIELKNIYSRQLPNMPKEYITRLVFDRRHRSVAIVKSDNTIVGGITYRPFHSQVFGEIAFCAVTASDQVQGYGSRLMSHTKELAKKMDKLTFFLTYADNNAVTFFAKQGFTTEVTTPREQWHGYIKDYDGGTLMECLLQEDLCYTSIAPMIQTQQMALAQKMSSLCSAFTIHQGLEYFKQPNVEPLRLEQIPGLKLAGWTPENEVLPSYKLFVDGRYQDPSREVVNRFGKFAVTDLQAHDDAVAFLQPVNPDEVPDYADIIKNPMDLSNIEKRLATGRYYINMEIFQADVRLIFKNAKLYNAAETYWYKAAHRLEQHFEQYLKARISENESA